MKKRLFEANTDGDFTCGDALDEGYFKHQHNDNFFAGMG